MRLRVVSPSRVELDAEVVKVSADGAAGSFSLLERHVDYVAALSAGMLWYEKADGSESFLAVDGGLLVKCGREVTVSTDRAVSGSLGELEGRIDELFHRRSEREQEVQTALDRIQADFVRQFIELQVRG